MLSKRLLSFVGNKIIFTPKRSFTQPTAPGGSVKGLTLQVTKGEEELEEALDFLEASFVRDEPVIGTFRIEDTCDLLRYLKHVLSRSHVIKLVNEDCEIMSAAVCGVIRPDGAEKTRTFAECSTCDPKTKRLINFWADVADSHNLFECFKVQEIWDVAFLSTAAEGRGKGLSKVLLAESKVLGKKEGHSIIRMDCTSHLSAKLAESMKWSTLPPRSALTFRDKKGCPWLPRRPPHPHGNIVITYDFLC